MEPRDPAVPPSPFRPQPVTPRAPGAPSSKSGCGRPLLIGCGAALILLGIGAVVFLLKAPAIAQWAFSRLEAEIAPKLPPDLPAADRQRLTRAFAAVREGLATGRIDLASLQPVQARLTAVAGKPQEQVTQDDIRGLTESLEKLAGVGTKPPP
jgi:hypothetical protein